MSREKIVQFICFSYLFEGVWCSTYPSSLPLCAWCGLAKRGNTAGCSRCSLRSNGTFLEVYSVTPRGSSLKCFGLKIDLSLGCGAHVLSRPRFLSTGSALGAPEPKSLHYYKTFCVHISETIIITESKSKLCTLICHFEFSAGVL